MSHKDDRLVWAKNESVYFSFEMSQILANQTILNFSHKLNRRLITKRNLNKSTAGMQHTPPLDIFNVSDVNQGL